MSFDFESLLATFVCLETLRINVFAEETMNALMNREDAFWIQVMCELLNWENRGTAHMYNSTEHNVFEWKTK